MPFLTTTITSRFPSTKNKIRTSSNPRNQATIQIGRVLDEEQLAFLADPGVVESQDTQTTIIHNAAFQTNDLNTFDSDCDEPPCAKAVLMANLSSYDSNVISEVPISKTIQHNSVFNNDVQGKYYFEQPTFDPALDIEITSDSNIISYAQYLKETESVAC
ncbi:hypothetical protein Tco_1347721 [Tanacetum coccineum]